ncbi:MAG: hypothetical protein JRN08_03095 [Nitrososphaerota archaeon]|nr:hypothetical protein [Nitrososphaerota archaeon]
MSRANRSERKRRAAGFLGSSKAKVVPLLLIGLLIAAATSTVYVFYTSNVLGTVRTPDLRLVAGSDSSASCTSYPCATVTVAATYDYATVGFSLFPSAVNTPQPATYYSNLTTVQNKGTAVHSIESVKVSGFANLANLGKVTLYYCTAQTEFNPDGTLVTPGNCVGSYAITSSSTGVQSVSGAFPVTLSAGAKGYIEVAAFGLNSASPGSTVGFQINVQWL